MTAMLYAAGAAAVVVLGVLWRLLSNASKGGYNKKEAEYAKARNENLRRIKAAADAGARVQPDDPGMHNDPHDLDR